MLYTNELRTLPPEINYLSKLEELDINSNKITIIPLDLWGINTNCKILSSSNPIEFPSPQLSKMKDDEIISFVRELLNGKENWNQLKLVFIGHGGAGKVIKI